MFGMVMGGAYSITYLYNHIFLNVANNPGRSLLYLALITCFIYINVCGCFFTIERIKFLQDSTHLEIYIAHSTRLSGKIATSENVQSYNKTPTGRGM